MCEACRADLPQFMSNLFFFFFFFNVFSLPWLRYYRIKVLIGLLYQISFI